LQLSDGATDQYPRAYLYRGGTFEVAISLAHAGQGLYTGVWLPSTAANYEAVFIVYTDPPRTVESPYYERVTDDWQPSDLIGAAAALGILDASLAGHTAPGTVGEALARASLAQKILRNRLELAEGAVNNWVLYDDDSITPLLTWSVTDKAGQEIRMNAFVPARRTRGA
jgi:hypothetical protein